jgi:apolipoprotein N-acyltransferase
LAAFIAGDAVGTDACGGAEALFAGAEGGKDGEPFLPWLEEQLAPDSSSNTAKQQQMALGEVMTDLPVVAIGGNSTAVPPAGSMEVAPSSRGRSWEGEDLYPVLSGLLMSLATPPVHLSFLAFVALVPLFAYLDKRLTFARTTRAGILAGAVYFGVSLSWLVAVGKFSWLAFPGYAIIVAFHILNFFFFIIPVVALKHYLSLPFAATAPFAWVACERLRGYGDLAFPWTNFGYSLTKFPFFLQFADLVGIYGVSFWLVVLNVILFEAIRSGSGSVQRRKYVTLWLALFGSVNLYNAVRWFQGAGPVTGHLNVALVQPNIPQRLKWNDRYSREILKKTFALNAATTRDFPDLVVWPETAIPYYVDENHSFHLTEMGQLPPGREDFLVGLLDSSTKSNGEPRFYNAAALFDSHGNMLQRYKKIYLVPVSERYPFRRLIGFTRSFFNIQDISYGAMDSGDERTVFTLPHAKFSVMICYESAFPQLSRTFRLRGANFLVNITNDAWFGKSFAPYQHAAFLVLRAIENRTAVVRCGNTGISGFLDPLGRWQQKTALFTEAIIGETIPLTNRLTFYTHFGDLIVYISYGVLGLFLLMAVRKKRFKGIAKRRAE